MSVPAIGGLPPVDPRTLPAAVRNGSADDRRAYAAAVGFERTLLEQLATSMVATADPAAEEGDATTRSARDLLPGALADALTAAGGIGLARELQATIAPTAAPASSPPPRPSGGAT
ncbi:hypothetical protein [Patulibacter defluvii]|uniref:hypothetical protein n=1 Tax=Patulibacter defluvii TaxID=3095358 RepID=UPI002A756998|nr:hypothetical protein [Patulibacter sp. DM4]